MEGTEEEEKDAKHNVNDVTIDTLFLSTVNMNAQKKHENAKNERRVAENVHAETMK